MVTDVSDRAYWRIPLKALSTNPSNVTPKAIANIATYTNNSKYQAVLQRHAEMILRGSQDGLPEELDRQDVQKQYDNAIQALKNQTLAERKK